MDNILRTVTENMFEEAGLGGVIRSVEMDYDIRTLEYIVAVRGNNGMIYCQRLARELFEGEVGQAVDLARMVAERFLLQMQQAGLRPDARNTVAMSIDDIRPDLIRQTLQPEPEPQGLVSLNGRPEDIDNDLAIQPTIELDGVRYPIPGSLRVEKDRGSVMAKPRTRKLRIRKD